MLQVLSYIAVGLGVMLLAIACLIALAYLADQYIEPSIDYIGDKYPKTTMAISSLVFGSLFILIFYMLVKLYW